MFSIVLGTRRDIEALKPLFITSTSEAEIIIIDTNYNDTTKQQLEKIQHQYYRVTYAPPMKFDKKEFVYKRDLVRCHNTGFAIAENEWIIKVDDCTEFKPDFFEKIKEDIKKYPKSVIRPVKLESWSDDTKWNQYHILRMMNRHERYIDLPRHGLGSHMFITLDQAVFPREAIDMLNGNDERFDIGHGWEDANLMQRFITYGYKIILDQLLMTYQTEHSKKLDPVDFSRVLYDITQLEVENGKYRAYNPYDIKQLRERALALKHIYKILKKETASTIGSIPVNQLVDNGGITPIELQIGKSGEHIEVTDFMDPDAGKSGWTPFKEYIFDRFFTTEQLEKNKEKILKLKDKHKGEDLFILGNSPDITKEFIEKIRGKTTFASNGFIVCKDIWNYEPTYMVITNQGVFDNHLRNMKPEFKQYEGGSVSDLFMDAKCDFIFSDLVLKPALVTEYQRTLNHDIDPPNRMKRRIDLLNKHVHIKLTNKQELEPPYMPRTYPTENDLSFNLEQGTYTSATVILDLMIPTAAYMGFKNIYLKGCSGGGGHFYDISPRHFWDTQHQKDIYELYGIFRKKLNENNIQIYNLDHQISEAMANVEDIKSTQQQNPTMYDGHLWNGTPYATRKILGKEPYLIPYKNIDDIL